ncbi:family 78 glycoside hydrolase catalytic domain [Paenibacillus sp. GCM10027626]|uniref:family 78 glycoside hydrolase catalytic domain n=1 Tax=Paenibacillus sp. GCM10027626 TaxID=3273411 RepID=UPI003641D2CD
MITISKLTVDYEENPLGIDNTQPALSWQMEADRRGEFQSAYRILVAESVEMLHNGPDYCWDSGIVVSGDSQHIIYSGKGLQSGSRYYWKVKVWDRDGKESSWSDFAYWEMGLLAQEEWRGRWITAPFLTEPQPEPDLLKGVPVLWERPLVRESQENPSVNGDKRYFRLCFAIGRELPVEAKLHVFAADSLCIYVNGHDEGLYYPYLQSVVLDVGSLLQQGQNVIACSTDCEKQGFVAVLSLVYADGRSELYADETGWKTAGHPGNEYEWVSVSMDDSQWADVVSIGTFGEGDWTVYKRILYPVNTAYGPCPVFGRSFRIDRPIEAARLYISALGIYQSSINGKAVGSDVFAPGWTDYHQRIPYQVYDVTSLLQAGDNLLEAVVGSGWYAGHLGICGPYHYGTKVAFRAEIRIDYEDGSQEYIATDEDWLAARSPVVSADIYMGETYDARLEVIDPTNWESVTALEQEPTGKMSAQQGPAIRPIKELVPQSITRIGESLHIIDMGQNMVGWLRLKLRGARGERVTLRYGEQLGPEGRLYRTNLRTAKQTDTYIASGHGEECYEPRFTYHGFQYVEIEGDPGDLTAERAIGIVVHSDAREISEVHTSHPLVNRLLDNIKWSQRGNFFGIPLDCPQRDERLGWTGDAHAFARTATYNMNCASFYTKWLTDIRDGQGADGAFPDVAPFVEHFGRGHVFFADGGVILPWTMYRVYGDRRFIEWNYDAMARWIDWLVCDSDEELIRRSESFGDHLSYGAETPKALINAAFFAYSVKLMARMAGEMDKVDDRARYEALFERLKQSFQKRFVQAEGRIACNTQTAYVLALMIGLLPEEVREAAMGRLVNNIQNQDWHLTTGFMGVSYVLPLLSEFGEAETAYRLLLQEAFPSWLYPVSRGATTIWERWDGWTEEKGFQDPEMNSFNHYALGSVGEWIYRFLFGIDLDEREAGFQSFRIRPFPGGGFAHARCRYDSLYGRITSDWEIAEERFILRVEVPVNCTAEVRLPACSDSAIWIDGSLISFDREEDEVNRGWTFISRDDQAAFFRAGSGCYEFQAECFATIMD